MNTTLWFIAIEMANKFVTKPSEKEINLPQTVFVSCYRRDHYWVRTLLEDWGCGEDLYTLRQYFSCWSHLFSSTALLTSLICTITPGAAPEIESYYILFHFAHSKSNFLEEIFFRKIRAGKTLEKSLKFPSV